MSETSEDERSLSRYDAELRKLCEMLHQARVQNGMRLVHASLNSGLSEAGLSRIERCERMPMVRSLLALTELYGLRIVIESGKVVE